METTFRKFEKALARVEARLPGAPHQEVLITRLYFHLMPRVHEFLNLGLKGQGLNETLFMALMGLYASEDMSIQPSSLSTMLGFSRTNATRVADELTRQGWAERRECADDRRCVRLHLTEAGIACIHRVVPVHREQLRDMWSSFEPEELAELQRLLRKLLVRLEA